MPLKFLSVMLASLLVSTNARAHSVGCFDNQCICRTREKSSSINKNLSISCRKQGFSSFPSDDLNRNAWQVTTIDLGENEISKLPENIILQQTKLKILKLDGNFIEDVDKACFNVSRTGKKNISPLELIDLTNNHLHFVPSCFGSKVANIASLENLETLKLGSNLFGSTINSKSFSGIRGLLDLNISNNGITNIPDLFFKRLQHLRSLDISKNSLQQISSMIFAQNVPLKVFRLDYNLLRNIPGNLPIATEELRLSHNKLQNITKVDAEELSRLTSLQVLDLSFNQIELIIYGTFSNLGNLVYLDLSHNSLKFLERNIFEGGRSLEYIFLQNNIFLTAIADYTFSTLPRLRYLFLYRCSLNTLILEDPAGPASPPLERLWIYDNPLTCNCRMVPLVRYLKSKQVQVDLDFNLGISDSDIDRVNEAVQTRVEEIAERTTPSICVGPLNRHYEVAGKPVLGVEEWLMTCPDEPFNIIVSCLLGIVTFTGVIPVVFFFVQLYLLLQSFVQRHIKAKDPENEDQ